jgi:ACS family sodium-dependent inorganic phosphate cotransporter
MRPLSLLLLLATSLLGVVQSSAFLVYPTCTSSSIRRPNHSINPLRSQYGHERFSIQQQLEEQSQLEKTAASIITDDDDSSLSKINNISPQPPQTTNQQTIDSEFYPILALCFCVTLLSALDRVAMSIAILPISAEFGYTETIKGQISSAVSYGYGAAILPIGLAVSVTSARLLMMVGVFLWSLATLGTPIMAELSSGSILLPLFAIRAVMGAAEAVVLPTMQRILANWVSPEKKATTLAIILSGFQLGTVSAYLVSPWLMDQMSGLDGGGADIEGWRGMFYLYGIAGLAWLLPWYFLAKDSPSSTYNISIGKAEDCTETFVNTMIEDDASLVFQECPVADDVGEEITKDAGGNTFKRIQDIQLLVQSAPWSDFFSSRGVWGMTLAHAAKNWELYNLLAWTPSFFSEQYGLNTKESAIYSIGPSLCGMIGGLTAGNLADFMLVKLSSGDSNNIATETRTNVRKLFQSVALFGPATCLFLLSNLPEQATTAQILLGGAVGLQAMDAAGFGAAAQEKAGERWAGLLYSLTSLPGVMIGSISVSVTGQILDMMSSEQGSGWTAVFQLNSLVCVAGAFCFLFLYDSKKEFD